MVYYQQNSLLFFEKNFVSILHIIAVVIIFVTRGGSGSKEGDKSGVKIETGQDDDETIVPNESGLSVDDGEVDTIDGSGDWVAEEEKTETDKHTSQGKTDSDKPSEEQDKTDSDKPSEDQDKTDEKTEDKDTGNMSEQNILVDDKIWGKID